MTYRTLIAVGGLAGLALAGCSSVSSSTARATLPLGAGVNPFDAATSTPEQRVAFVAANTGLDFVDLADVNGKLTLFNAFGSQVDVDYTAGTVTFNVGEPFEYTVNFDPETGETGSSLNILALSAPAFSGDYAAVVPRIPSRTTSGGFPENPRWGAYTVDYTADAAIPTSGTASFLGAAAFQVLAEPGQVYEYVSANVAADADFASGDITLLINNFSHGGTIARINGSVSIAPGNGSVYANAAFDQNNLSVRNASNVQIGTGSGFFVNFAGPNAEELFGDLDFTASGAAGSYIGAGSGFVARAND